MDSQQPSGKGGDSAGLADLFPLALSPFEKFILWDERPPHPMNSFIELHFESPLSVQQLEESLAIAVHRNPLLACRVVGLGAELSWHYDPDYRPELRMETEHPPLQDGWPVPIDLRNECGSRYWYAECGSGSRLLIQLHHACSDGVGLRRVLIDALTGYSRAVSGSEEDGESQSTVDSAAKPAVWEKLNAASLRDRFDFSGTFNGPPARPLTTLQRLKNARFFHLQLPQPLRASRAHAALTNKSELNNADPLRHVILSRELSSQVMDRTRQDGVGVNDVALAFLFRTCAKWNQLQGETRSSARIRLLMPYDLRSRVDLRMPAANRLSFSFLGRTHRDCERLPELIESIHAEIKAIKDSRLPLDFLDALKAAARVPRLAKWAIGRSRNMSTAVLTYTGDISRGMKKYFPEDNGARLVGDARLTNILVAPPVRENTNVSLGLCINWGQLCISAAWNRDVLSAADCDEFLAMYEMEWREWVALKSA